MASQKATLLWDMVTADAVHIRHFIVSALARRSGRQNEDKGGA